MTATAANVAEIRTSRLFSSLSPEAIAMVSGCAQLIAGRIAFAAAEFRPIARWWHPSESTRDVAFTARQWPGVTQSVLQSGAKNIAKTVRVATEAGKRARSIGFVPKGNATPYLGYRSNSQ